MEKKPKRIVREVSATPKSSLLGQKAKFQFGEGDVSWLIGGVVEKGVVEKPLTRPPSAPVPTVLPFPVARHRAHGPHWAPVQNQVPAEEEGEGDDGDDGLEYDAVSAFAKPVPRKEKKGLDFSQVKELIEEEKKKGNMSSVKESKKHKSCGERVDGDVKYASNRCNVSQDFNRPKSSSKGDANCDSEPGNLGLSYMEIDNANQNLPHVESGTHETIHRPSPVDSICPVSVDRVSHLNSTPTLPSATLNMYSDMPEVKERVTSVPGVVSISSPSQSEYHSAPMTLESEIDAENSARLRGMSPDEIAQAQLELMEKMNPSVVEALKKRGQHKMMTKKYLGTGSSKNTQSDTVICADPDLMSTTLPEDSCPPTDLNTAPSADQSTPESHFVRSEPTCSSLWNIWSARVEAVRNVRFSLDGSVVEVDNAQPGQTPGHVGLNTINVSERDFLRTEGDPGAAGYTILEAVELTRSVVPAQRALALHLLACILRNAVHNILVRQPIYKPSKDSYNSSVDWEAIWAFALGPEPKLVLALRLCMDDNHTNVILACLKVIQCILSYDENESFFNMAEKTALFEKSIYTAPIFRSKPEVDSGFLQGGYWKYSAKPSNIVPYEEDKGMTEMAEADHKIQDDLHFAGQDFAGGLVRMGILPRICYLLENNALMALEDYLISILIALARHSPKSATAIIRCPGLVQTVANKCIRGGGVDITSTKIKYVTLCKVLAQSDKEFCLDIIKNGHFRSMTWQLYRCYPSLDHWMKSVRDNCKLASELMVEQLRFWKVCIQYGYCVSDYVDIFPALCLWFNPPSFEKILGTSMFNECVSISMEAFLVLGALARRLSKFEHHNLSEEVHEMTDDGTEYWSWSHVGPLVDLALKWLALRSDQSLSELFRTTVTDGSECGLTDDPPSSLLWVIAAILHFLSDVLERSIPEDVHVPWLPDFVPKIGLQLLKNDFLSFSDFGGEEALSSLAHGTDIIDYLCSWRQSKGHHMSLASVCCIFWLVQVIDFSDTLIQAARKHIPPSIVESESEREEKLLAEGVVKSSMSQFRKLLSFFMKLSALEWRVVQSIEKFGRGGPAPGVGVGWGASGGGFWSEDMILFAADNRVLIKLLQMLRSFSGEPQHTTKELASLENINSVLGAILTFGPRDDNLADKAFDILLQVPALKCLDHFIRQFSISKGGVKPFTWEYAEEDFTFFSSVLIAHFKTYWLCKKQKKNSKASKDATSHQSKFKRNGNRLETISEVLDSSMASERYKPTSLIVEWTRQRLPLPLHWFLSPISTIKIIKGVDFRHDYNTSSTMCNPGENTQVISSGLFFLLGIEAASSFLSPDVQSPIQAVPLVWKLHSLSVVLLSGMDVIDEKSKHIYEALQELYGQRLDKPKLTKTDELILDKNEILTSGKKHAVESLRFQSDIHESYPTFIEALVEQYAALSYGDITYGRQIAMYLRRDVEASVRLSAWKELSSASILELLPPLFSCIGAAEGYLEPAEDDERILEAYVKSWESGTLDKAAVHGSVAFTLVLHHLSSFIFLQSFNNKSLLRNKLVKALLRDFCRKKKHQGMMLQLVQYNKPPTATTSQTENDDGVPWQGISIERRLEILSEACEGNLSLLEQVNKLKSFLLSS